MSGNKKPSKQEAEAELEEAAYEIALSQRRWVECTRADNQKGAAAEQKRRPELEDRLNKALAMATQAGVDPLKQRELRNMGEARAFAEPPLPPYRRYDPPPGDDRGNGNGQGNRENESRRGDEHRNGKDEGSGGKSSKKRGEGHGGRDISRPRITALDFTHLDFTHVVYEKTFLSLQEAFPVFRITGAQESKNQRSTVL